MEKFNYLTGDIIHATAAPPSLGILGHQGIVLVENDEIYIYHNTPINGSAIKDTLEQFLVAKREILSFERTNLSENDITTRFEEVKHKKFNWFSWNCDHFINYMLSGEQKSPQIKKILLTTIAIISFYLLSKIIKK